MDPQVSPVDTVCQIRHWAVVPSTVGLGAGGKEVEDGAWVVVTGVTCVPLTGPTLEQLDITRT